MKSESKRTLAAVMFTDIVGYTAMMHSDEDLARQKVQSEQSIKISYINYFLELSEEASPHFFGSKAEFWSLVI